MHVQEGMMTTMTERRRMTRNKMYRFIYNSEKPVSKQQIAAATRYSLPTVHQNIAELLEADLIRPGEIQKSTGGRPAVGYTVNQDLRYSIGIAVTANHIRLLACDLLQNEVAYHRVNTQTTDSFGIGRQIAEELETFITENKLDRERILGVGITVPGVIDRKKDRIMFSPTLKMKNISLKDIRDAIPYPTFIENDSTSAGAAEWLGLSPEDRDRDFVYLFLENGIGGAIYIDGKQYTGINRRSAEFGHICIVPDGRPCNCGQKGCLESYCSALRFTRDLGITAEEFFDGLEKGNVEYAALWEDVLQHLSLGINNLRMAFDCDVILGGFVSRYLGPYMDHLKKLTLARSSFDRNADYIRLGKYPLRAGMMGVAWHFTEAFIDSI